MSEDMLPLADACRFTGGSFQREYAGRLHPWDPSDRAHLAAQLDATYFRVGWAGGHWGLSTPP